MPATPLTARLVVENVDALRTAMLSGAVDWAIPEEVDVAGAQLLVAALRAGLPVPDEVLGAAPVQRLWGTLGLHHEMPYGTNDPQDEVPSR